MKSLIDDLREMTLAGNVATVAVPLGAVLRRPWPDMWKKRKKRKKTESLDESASVWKQMVDIDSKLDSEAQNWNHNLAAVFKLYEKFASRPAKLAIILAKFDAPHWLSTAKAKHGLEQVRLHDKALAKSIIREIRRWDGMKDAT